MLRIELQDRVIMLDEHLLRRIQAIWRGKLLRQQMLRLQVEYLRTAAELEQPTNSSITWMGSPIGLPIFAQKPVISKRALNKKIGLGLPSALSIDNSKHQRSRESFPSPSAHAEQAGPPVIIKNRTLLAQSDTQVNQASHIANNFTEKDSNTRVQPKLHEDINHKQNSITQELAHPRHHTQEIKSDQLSNTSQRLKPSEYEVKERSEESRCDKMKDNHSDDVLQKESSVNWNETSSLWNSFDASTIASPKKHEKEKERPTLKDLNRDELQIAKSHIAMELLWIQQAINSRKQYLQIKSQIGVQQ